MGNVTHVAQHCDGILFLLASVSYCLECTSIAKLFQGYSGKT